MSAATAKILMLEEVQFRIDCGELGIQAESEAGFRQLRSCASERAKDVIELYLVEGEGKGVCAILDLVPDPMDPARSQEHRNQAGGYLVTQILQRLEAAVHLTPERRTQIAVEIDGEARMLGDTAADAEQFQTRWRRARYVLHAAGLIPNTDQLVSRLNYQGVTAADQVLVREAIESSKRKEMNEMLEKRISPSVFEFIKQLHPTVQPRNCEEVMTALGQWIESQNRKATRTPVINTVQSLSLIHISEPPRPY